MARHYSTKDFFRHTPNTLLARYFQGRRILGDLDFATMKETKPDELLATWLSLSDGQHNAMDAESRGHSRQAARRAFGRLLTRPSFS